jgi:LIVCS family branched-chain amino acid:cation transporter
MRSLSKKQLVFISLMLFSMFFGAGNLIFPPFLGYQSGENVSLALSGFILSAVGLPILGVAAVAKAGSFQAMARRVHPAFAVLFPLLIYISIGPGLAIPRAGSLAFEMGMMPFLPEAWSHHPLALLLYTAVFFAGVWWLSMSPSKLVDRFGKLLTPLLLTLILVIFVKSWFTPVGQMGEPQNHYQTHPIFQGFLDGYLTMDALAALVFGIVVADVLRSKGVHGGSALSGSMIVAGLGAGVLLSAIYLMLGYLGASSGGIGEAKNGAQILTHVVTQLFGASGGVILGLLFTLACFCVSIGLVTSCSQYFSTVFPRISYSMWVKLLTLGSLWIANLGLTQILQVSVPILGAIYPVAIVLIVLALLDRSTKGTSSIYGVTVTAVSLFTVGDLFNTTFLSHEWDFLLATLPLYEQGVGWLTPALVGILLGSIMDRVSRGRKRRNESTPVETA